MFYAPKRRDENGSSIREWMYLEDDCRSIEIVRKHGSVEELWGWRRTNLTVARSISDAVAARETLVESVEDRPGGHKRYAPTVLD